MTHMKKTTYLGLIISATSILTANAATESEILQIKIEGKDLVSYQTKPLSNPKGGDKFKGSNFIHPLKTPSGFVVTDSQPSDHLHHFGLWWPWKYIQLDDRKVLCWELQQGDGFIQAQESKATRNGFTAKSIYIDRKAPDGPKTLINETLNATLSKIMDKPTKGYYLDLEIIHEVAVDKPITISKCRYSGFALRGAASWNKDNSRVMTSEGKDYDKSNFTRAKWVKVEGESGESKTAGVVMMSRPDNHDHPEKLRTWDRRMQNGAIFINFNSVQEKSWMFEPGKKYTRNFRLFVYDGSVTAEQAEDLWKQYSATVPD